MPAPSAPGDGDKRDEDKRLARALGDRLGFLNDPTALATRLVLAEIVAAPRCKRPMRGPARRGPRGL